MIEFLVIVVMIFFAYACNRIFFKNSGVSEKTKEGRVYPGKMPPDNFENELIVYVAGTHIAHRTSYIINNCYEGMPVALEAEPTNRYDKNAIKVIEYEKVIGYIPSDKTHLVHPLLALDHKVYIHEMTEEDSYSKPGSVHVTLYIKIRY